MKRIRKVIFAGLMSAFGLTVTSVQAMEEGKPRSWESMTVGACTLSAHYDTDYITDISVRISNLNTTRAAGGATWDWDPIRDDNINYDMSPASTDFLETTCGLIDVSSLSQKGADAASISEEDELFLRFSARESATGPLYAYEARVSPNAIATVTKESLNIAPTADAGSPQTVTSGTEVTLAGLGSDTDGTIVSYNWYRASGTGDAANAVLSDATAQNPTFTDSSLTSNDSPVTHVFGLRVYDNHDDSSAVDLVTITINPPANAAPTATVGANQSVTSGTEVALSGSGSDTDGTIASYSWTRTGGTGAASDAVLSNATAQNPTFTDI